MVAASRILGLLVALAVIVGCGSGDPESKIGEVTTSKAGADAVKANGGKPLPRSPDMVPSVDD